MVQALQSNDGLISARSLRQESFAVGAEELYSNTSPNFTTNSNQAIDVDAPSSHDTYKTITHRQAKHGPPQHQVTFPRLALTMPSNSPSFSDHLSLNGVPAGMKYGFILVVASPWIAAALKAGALLAVAALASACERSGLLNPTPEDMLTPPDERQSKPDKEVNFAYTPDALPPDSSRVEELNQKGVCRDNMNPQQFQVELSGSPMAMPLAQCWPVFGADDLSALALFYSGSFTVDPKTLHPSGFEIAQEDNLVLTSVTDNYRWPIRIKEGSKMQGSFEIDYAGDTAMTLPANSVFKLSVGSKNSPITGQFMNDPNTTRTFDPTEYFFIAQKGKDANP